MYTYFGFLSFFMLIFAMLCALAYMPKVIIINKWIKANVVFLSTVLIVIFFRWSEFIKLSYLLAVGSILCALNLYILLISIINFKHKLLRIFFDFVWCGLTIFASSVIIAYIENIPIKHIILEMVSEGSYTFKPGYFNEMWLNSISFSAIFICCKYIYIYFTDKWIEVQQLKIDKLESEKKSIETQFDTLQAKVNPHFLYNALNSIAGLSTIDGEKTRDMSLALSNFFRYSMNREQQVMTTVLDEAKMIETYLKIEQIRFYDLLNYKINISVDAESYPIPRMLILPIVENSIKHGMRDDRTPLFIDVSFIANA